MMFSWRILQRVTANTAWIEVHRIGGWTGCAPRYGPAGPGWATANDDASPEVWPYVIVATMRRGGVAAIGREACIREPSVRGPSPDAGISRDVVAGFELLECLRLAVVVIVGVRDHLADRHVHGTSAP